MAHDDSDKQTQNSILDPNTQFSFGSRPLHRACSYRMVSCVKTLLEMGANPTLKDNKNRDPMSRIRNGF